MAHIPLNKQKFLNGIEMCLSNTYFNLITTTIYKFLVSPLAALIANLVMEHIGNNIIDCMPIKRIFFIRYVDELITCLRINAIEYFQQNFKQYHHKLNFTIEKTTIE